MVIGVLRRRIEGRCRFPQVGAPRQKDAQNLQANFVRNAQTPTTKKAHRIGVLLGWRRSINLIRTDLKFINYNKIFSINANLRNIFSRPSFREYYFPMVIDSVSAYNRASIAFVYPVSCIFSVFNYKFNHV